MSSRELDVAVIIPVFGQHTLTYRVLEDLATEIDLADVYLVDNGGDYRPMARERVLRQPRNLGWAAGSNVGLDAAASVGYRSYVLMNNDVRLSRGFLSGLSTAAATTGAALIGPLYDDAHTGQLAAYRGTAAGYRPRSRHRVADYLDGTCFLIPAPTLSALGGLDAKSFGQTGWGADIDYCIRARDQVGDVVVTHLAYLNHLGAGTGRTAISDYHAKGLTDMKRGLTLKYGNGVADLVPGLLEPPISGKERRRLLAGRAFRVFAPSYRTVKRANDD